MHKSNIYETHTLTHTNMHTAPYFHVIMLANRQLIKKKKWLHVLVINVITFKGQVRF